MPEAIGVVDVLVAAEPPERGLTEQADHPMLSVPSGPRVHKPLSGRLRQSEGFIKLPERKEPCIGRDLGTVEFQLQAPIEIKPQCPGFMFTHQVSHLNPSNPTAISWEASGATMVNAGRQGGPFLQDPARRAGPWRQSDVVSSYSITPQAIRGPASPAGWLS
jgi:hypothetical protein